MKSMITNNLPVKNLAVGNPRRESLERIILLISAVSTVNIPLFYFNSYHHSETVVTLLLAILSWTCWLLFRLGYRKYTAHAMVFLTLGIAVVGMLIFGAVRSSAHVLLIAAVVGAGIFLRRRALIAAVTL
jgi:hypothetical protein